MSEDINIFSLLGKSFICPYCGREHFIPVKKVLIKEDAFPYLSSFISSLVSVKSVLLLCDNITYEIAGRKCESALKEDFETYSYILYPQEHMRVYAEERYIEKIVENAEGKDLILTIGSGTITDMGKFTGHKLNIPVVAFPTAPSMNAYTSPVASFLSKGGIKSTVPSNPPIGVIGDLGIISNAPIEMIKSGFADSFAKAFANADWRMSSFLTGEKFCPLPLKMVTKAEKKYIYEGEKILKRNKEIISFLMEGLILGGFSMIIAGKSSPASGGEHLISHFLDMDAHKKKIEPYSYHGLQVGLGILVSSYLYDKLRDLEEKDVRKMLKLRKINYEEKTEIMEKDFPSLKGVFEKKVPYLLKLSKELPSLWNRIKEKVLPEVYPYKEVKEILKKTGCPLHFSEIGVNEDLARKAITYGRYIRDRITILDISDELGLFEDNSFLNFFY